MKQILRTLTKLLYMGLNDCAWKITRISIENQCRIIAYFELKKRRRVACSKCGALARHQCLSVREHLALHQILLIGAVRLYVCVRQPLIYCSHCGCRGVCYPNWLKADKRYSEAFKAFISWLCRTMSCAAVGSLCHLDPKTVKAIDKEMLQETTPVADLSNTRRLLVDEKGIGKGRFATIVLDADYIAHAIVLKLTNGAIESFNRKIADLLRRGYDYKDPSYFF